MKHFSALRAAGRRIDVPALCRGRHEHRSCDRAGFTHRLPSRAYRGRAARRLHPCEQGIPVQLWVGRSMLEPHLLQLHLQFFGDQHGDGGVVALTHLDIGHGQDDLSVAADSDEGVRRKASVTGLGCDVGERQAQAQHQAAAGRRSGPQELAAGEIARRKRLVRVDEVGSDAIEDHCQPSLPVDCAACLIAWRMRT